MTNREWTRAQSAVIDRLQKRLHDAAERLRWNESDFEAVAGLIAKRVDEARQGLDELRRMEAW